MKKGAELGYFNVKNGAKLPYINAENGAKRNYLWRGTVKGRMHNSNIQFENVILCQKRIEYCY